MTPEELRRAAEGITDTLASIDAGTLDATATERAYLTGALHALRAALGEADARFPV
jgi:hypothetical protein